MRYFEKLAKKRKAVDTALEVGAVGSAGLLGVSGSRAYYQNKAEPDLIKVRGGTTTELMEPVPGFRNSHTVFDTQRKGYVKAFRDNGVKVNEVASYVIHKKPYVKFDGVAMGAPRVYEFPIGEQTKKVPIATMDIGNSPGAELRARLSKIFKGLPIYKTFSDLGPGNQHQPYRDGFLKNMMYSSKGNSYTRNIVPGGSGIEEKAVPAELDSIDVKNIATVDKRNLTSKVTKKPLVSISYGSGFGWKKDKFPHFKDNISAIVKGLDGSYGAGNYNLAILGGPNTSEEFSSHFKELSKTNKNIKYLKKLTSKGVHNLMASSDIAVTAPGSVVSELMSKPGRKPKILAFVPESNTSSHFNYNSEWLKTQMPEAVRKVTLSQELPTTSTEILDKVNELRKGKNYHNVVNFDGEDVKKIMDTAKADLSRYKTGTKNIAKVGLTGLGLTGGAIGLRYLLNNRDKK